MTRDFIREYMATVGSTFVSVTFVKKDGTLRTMVVNPLAGRKTLTGTRVAASAKRAANHPHLLNMWDIHSAGWRSINIDTVQQITALGATHEVA